VCPPPELAAHPQARVGSAGAFPEQRHLHPTTPASPRARRAPGDCPGDGGQEDPSTAPEPGSPRVSPLVNELLVAAVGGSPVGFPQQSSRDAGGAQTGPLGRNPRCCLRAPGRKSRTGCAHPPGEHPTGTRLRVPIMARVDKLNWELVVKNHQFAPRCWSRSSLPNQFKAHQAEPSASPSHQPSTDLQTPGHCGQSLGTPHGQPGEQGSTHSPRAGELGATGVTGKGQGSHLADFPAVLPEHEVGGPGHLPHGQLLGAAQGAGCHLPQGHADVVDGQQDLLLLGRGQAHGPGWGERLEGSPGGSAHTMPQPQVPWCSPCWNDKLARPFRSCLPTRSGFSGEIKHGEDQAPRSIGASRVGLQG